MSPLAEKSMTNAAEILLGILREAWVALAAAMLAFAALAMLAQVLKTASGSVLGASLMVWEALAALFGVVVLALFGFLGVPAIVSAAQSSMPSSAGSGPVTQLSQFCAVLIGGIAALRMLRAVFAAVAYSAVGGSGRLADTLIESGEALLGMVVASLAIPIAATFL
jgi:hypothetical protein